MELALKKKKVSAPTVVYAAGDTALRVGTPLYRSGSNTWFIADSYLKLNSGMASPVCVGIRLDTSKYRSAKITGTFLWYGVYARSGNVGVGIANSNQAANIQAGQYADAITNTSNKVYFQYIGDEQTITVDISNHSGTNIIAFVLYDALKVTKIEMQ